MGTARKRAGGQLLGPLGRGHPEPKPKQHWPGRTAAIQSRCTGGPGASPLRAALQTHSVLAARASSPLVLLHHFPACCPLACLPPALPRPAFVGTSLCIHSPFVSLQPLPRHSVKLLLLTRLVKHAARQASRAAARLSSPCQLQAAGAASLAAIVRLLMPPAAASAWAAAGRRAPPACAGGALLQPPPPRETPPAASAGLGCRWQQRAEPGRLASRGNRFGSRLEPTALWRAVRVGC